MIECFAQTRDSILVLHPELVNPGTQALSQKAPQRRVEEQVN